MARQLGICIGATSVKVTLLDGTRRPQSATISHHGDVVVATTKLLKEFNVHSDTKVLATGTEGRRLLCLPSVIEAQAAERAVAGLHAKPSAVVSLGGEDFVVYLLQDGRIANTFSGDKCASGTGEFFRQQLLRMNLTLEEANSPELQGRVCGLSTRCSVFMKSDCTHRLNKGEATKADIVLSLVWVMATKVTEFLAKARITTGEVWLVGGVSQNRHIAGFLKQMNPGITFVSPENALVFESFGAALLADQLGTSFSSFEGLFKPKRISYEKYPALRAVEPKVHFMSARRGKPDASREYVLGVDGGSTTTKVVLLDPETFEICGSHYGRTHGNPVAALRECAKELIAQIREATGQEHVRIRMCAVTGSSRELLGAYLDTPAVYNEIIAHATGTSYFDREIDTIFEIGGQDAKYVYLRNGVPIDYAMNEACSAGTGSFLEEAAHSDLAINSAPEIGPIAEDAACSLKFGEHCSAFINSDIRKAIQQGALRESIVGGLVHSIVSNYLNRVVGNRRIGGRVALQGGVAKNRAVPLAFASILKKDIVVPPDPELLGAFGVAMMAVEKEKAGLLTKGDASFEKILSTPFEVEREFKCAACENACPIKVLQVGDKKCFFGGRCNKYTNIRKNIKAEKTGAEDLVRLRTQMLFSDFAPSQSELQKGTGPRVGIPMCFTVYSLWPLMSTFFRELDVPVVVPEKIRKEGFRACESAYCYPGEIAHGSFAELLDKNCDLYFLPHIEKLPTWTSEVHACFCPVTQGLPYYLRTAFGIEDSKILRPVVRMENSWEEGEGAFVAMAEQLGRTREQAAEAFAKGLKRLFEFQEACQRKGAEILETLERENKNAIVLFGRPYNAFAKDANMDIPLKFQTRGFTVIPFDFIPVERRNLTYNMYWHYGQQNVSVAATVKSKSNLFLCYISNFSCGPDSFLLHIAHWIMGIKPYLVLEIDSHTADAGLDTRIEAFLDILESYRKSENLLSEAPYQRKWDVRFLGNRSVVHNNRTGEEIDFRNPRVRLIWPSMGRYSSEIIQAASTSLGIDSIALPVGDVHTTQLARDVASGKECIPTLLVLGSVLQYIATNPPNRDDVFVVMVPKTTGPCRTGQYAYFYERTFHHIGLEDIAIMDLSSDNSYNEMGPGFTRKAWWGLVIADCFRDMEVGLRVMAQDKAVALRQLESAWQETLALFRAGRFADTKAFAQISKRIAAIPRSKQLANVPKILVVGEIFVRRDNFSVDPLIEQLSEKGIFGKIAGITEWIHYTDSIKKGELRRDIESTPAWKRPFCKATRDMAMLQIELWYKRMVEGKVLRAFSPTGLIPHAPHDMDRIMAHAKTFTDPLFATEATVSTCVGVEAMIEGYSGVVAIAPFACLPGRLIKALLGPYMRTKGWPFLALENDGFVYPPATVNRIEVFMLSVLRYAGQDPELPPSEKTAVGKEKTDVASKFAIVK